ncbi:hypothetical protein [Tuwongella immobilis]|uniref:Uncharacterized protein n=1 Tax=Tuwongella immobilis TaxID=692036 RepID=A0A6C2YI05_9BACT|nr:hypothetical protein [Tuwongella immobilis]VIP00695.1 Uncharacterized protein OS=Singulisphaera acidiphila (strain ATCC BAA-1392 / DSM 18658 / VKM B-2454 / MOB10) GN=Sinac_1118 PE=4 SV=1 [Tuwongella immobilis]VTR96808.1 Uncharacterized protein OS=Singulisphaera acidiphila (strain ATCC BAA-1392 / DSM 18658 / VKM B-2454 / MOB10) GN=Sinac_1118 PE=4 SV=1 [Tuwongella immobilis]
MIRFKRWTTRIGLGLLLSVSASPLLANPTPEGVEVLARGPIHEAYATPVEPNLTPNPIIPKEPPPAIEELPPEQKPAGDDVEWLPGYWSWDEERNDFIWISGFWRVPPPGRVWLPGSWERAGNGWQWTSGFWTVQQQQFDPQPQAPQAQAELQYLPQPPAPVEVGPAVPPPTQEHIYVPGCWIWRDRYVWRPGFWIAHRPNWVYMPACYRYTPAGYVFVDGYWDYPLADRGVLFAPVVVRREVYVQPSWVYTPSYVVREQSLYGAMFVRRGYGTYYFGDYFEPRYRTVGFSAWVNSWGSGFSLSVSRGYHYDPLYSYYRCNYRDDRFWSAGITDLYVGRYRGDIGRPPRTLIQQNNVIVNNVTNNTIINNVTNITNNNVMLTSLNNVQQVAPTRFTSVLPESRTQYAANARAVQQFSQQRAQAEARLVRSTPTPNGIVAPSAPQTVRLNVPTPRPVPRAANTPVPTPRIAPPPLPITNDRTRPIPTPRAVPTPTPTPNPGSGVRPVVPTPTPRPGIPTPTPRVNPTPTPTPTPNPGSGVRPVMPNPIPRPGIPTPTPTPTPRVNPTPTPTPTPNPGSGVRPVVPNPIPRPGIPTPTPVPRVNPTPTPTPTPRPSIPSPVPVPRGNPTPTPAPRVNPTPTPAPRPSIPTPTPTPRFTPSPTPTPRMNPAPTPPSNPAPRFTPPSVPRVNPTPTPTPRPAPTPAPRANPAPTPAPTPRFTPPPRPAPTPAPRVNPAPTPAPRANPAPRPAPAPRPR